MGAHVLLNLLNELGKSDKMLDMPRMDLGQSPIQSAQNLTACG